MNHFDKEKIEKLIKEAESLTSSNLHERSIEVLREALEINPKNIKVLGDLGFALSKLNKNQQAIEMYEKILAIYPNNINALNGKAYSLTLVGQYKNAIDVCNLSIMINRKNTEPFV